MARDPGPRISMLRYRIDTIRLALDGITLDSDVRQVLLAMLDEAERELRSVEGRVPLPAEVRNSR